MMMKKKSLKMLVFSFLLYFVAQFKFLNDSWFGTDELDIMVLGKSIARGHLLYKDLCSQHMPFSYYISALFDFLGFRTVDEQRLAFYILIAFFWALIYVRYSHVINNKALFLSPIIFCSVLQSYDWGTQILSEHLAGCGAVILLLEYLDFLNTKEITFTTSIMVSIAVILTFGTMFIGIYAVFFIGLGVLLCEIGLFVKEKNSFRIWIIYMLKKYLKLIIIVSFPWVLLFGYYSVTGTMRDFVFGAYTLNRTIYQEYIGGMGSNVFALFFQPVDMVGNFFVSTMNISEWTYSTILFLILIIGAVIFVGKKWIAKKRTEAIIIFMFTFSLGVRGVFNFHGTASVEVLTLLFSSVLFDDFIGEKSEFMNKSVYMQSAIYVLLFFVLSGYFRDISEVASIKINDETMGREASIVKAITDEDESVWCPVFRNDILMMSDRSVGLGYPATPWTWRGYEKKFKEDSLSPARVLIYYEGHDVWGNKQEEYAKPIEQLVKKEYTQIDDLCIFVRNDYYNDAKKIIDSLE